MNKINISHKERERHDFALQLETVIQKRETARMADFILLAGYALRRDLP